MNRNLTSLHQQEFDILVIGGGIYGACVCWDAASRGLSTALIEKGDFGNATSAASLKVIHGGLRYLQTGNLHLMQLMKHEQRIWMNIAPHQIHPISCYVPTYTKFTRSKPAFQFAVAVNNLVDWYGNISAREDKKLEFGRIFDTNEFRDLFPGIRPDGITGGSTWTEASIENPSRLIQSILQSAVASGAQVANYVEAIKLIDNEGQVKGVTARDIFSGQEFDIRSRITVNCAGGWVDDLYKNMKESNKKRRYFNRSIAFNLVTRGILQDRFLLGFSSYLAGKMNDQTTLGPILFTLNWGKHTLFGTKHIPDHSINWSQPFPESIVQEFIDEINSGFPEAELQLDDIVDVLWGYLPMEDNQSNPHEVKLVRDIQVIDHEKDQGIKGLLTVIGVRYTLARYIAEITIDLVLKKINITARECQTRTQPVLGGNLNNFNKFVSQKLSEFSPDYEKSSIKQLLHSYGSNYQPIFKIIDEIPSAKQTIDGNRPVLYAEIINAIRNEMAFSIADIVRRRTEIAPIGRIDEYNLTTCANIMAQEFKWDNAQIHQAIEASKLEGAWKN